MSNKTNNFDFLKSAICEEAELKALKARKMHGKSAMLTEKLVAIKAEMEGTCFKSVAVTDIVSGEFDYIQTSALKKAMQNAGIEKENYSVAVRNKEPVNDAITHINFKA